MDDPSHLEKFNHDCSRDLQVNLGDIEKKCSQDVDFLLVLDLEGKVEILEFPVLLMDAKSLGVVDFFHRLHSFSFTVCLAPVQFIFGFFLIPYPHAYFDSSVT